MERHDHHGALRATQVLKHDFLMRASSANVASFSSNTGVAPAGLSSGSAVGACRRCGFFDKPYEAAVSFCQRSYDLRRLAILGGVVL